MSFCRFSSDNWKCDLYCYGATGDVYVTHVAARKIVGEVPPLDWSLLRKVDGDLREFQRQYEAQMKWLETCERVEIGLPYDGDTFQDPDLPSFLATVRMLKEAGYNVPEWLPECIEAEINGYEMEGPES